MFGPNQRALVTKGLDPFQQSGKESARMTPPVFLATGQLCPFSIILTLHCVNLFFFVPGFDFDFDLQLVMICAVNMVFK